MKYEQQIPRNALVWMIISLFALVAPHIGRLPPWVLGVYVFAALWRIQVYRGRWSFPGWLVKLALTVTAGGGIVLSFGSLLDLESMVALLLTACALKMIELASRKDAYVLIFLGYFVCITEFLFTQDLLMVLYVFAVNLTLLTTALIALHQPGQHEFTRSGGRQAMAMLAQAFPLMLVLFFLFPRIGPLWSVPLKSSLGKTGISDSVKPGDISRLSQSDEVAFRVQFDGEIPPRAQLYWRGLVLSRLKDGAWTTLSYYRVPPAERRPDALEQREAPLNYSVIMEPTQQHWLFALRRAQSSTPGVMQGSDYRLFSVVPLEDEYRYSVRSWSDAILEPELSEWRRETELDLPGEDNPRSRALARELRAAAESDAAFVQSVLDKFYREPYAYTLEPPPLGDQDAMDRFLFETRRGFCEHYAYAFVLLMRAAGVPARVVAGYQGGEINPVNQTVIVHQFDAHAWAEVWFPERGWVRVDPTASVAPERVELGLEAAVLGEGTFLAQSPLSPLRYRSINWINQIRLRYDALTYRWQSWVVSFDGERQLDLLSDWFGELSMRRFAVVFIGSWGAVLSLVALALLRQRDTHRVSALDKVYLRFCDRLAQLGLPRQQGEAPGRYATRVAQEWPHLAPEVSRLTGRYVELAYSPDRSANQASAVGRFRRDVQRFRPTKPRE